MQSHVKVLAILHIVFGGIGIISAIFLLLLFGGLTGVIGMNASGEDAAVAVPLIGGIGLLVAGGAAFLSVPSLIAGIGLLSFRSWARVLTLVLSALLLVQIPFGTALGVYGFWVLLSREGSLLFERRASSYSYPPV